MRVALGETKLARFVTVKKIPEWQRRRFERLGIALPEQERPRPTAPAAEHRTALADERAMREAVEEAKRAD